MKKTVSLVIIFALLLCMAMPTFADNQTKIKITASKTEFELGEEIDITVSFDGAPAGNISVLELIVPVNSDAFEVVADSAKSALPTLSSITTGGAAYRAAKSDVFCNWVDIQSVIPTTTTEIFRFKVKATEYAKNGGHTFTIDDECFLVDNNDNDIFFDVIPCTVTLSGSPEKEIPTQEPSAAVTPGGNADSGTTGEDVEIIEKGNDNILPWLVVGGIVVLAAAVVIISTKGRKK